MLICLIAATVRTMFRGTKLSPTMVDTKSSQEEFGWFVNELAGHYFGPRKPSWRFVKACLACAIVVPPVFYELFQVDLIEKAGYGWLRPFTYGFGFDNIWRMFVASRRLQLYQPPSDTPGFVEAGPVWKLLEDPKSLPYDDNFRAILAKSRQGKTTAAIHGANVNCGVKKCIPFLRFYVSVLKPQYWGNAAAEQESWVYVRVQRGLRDDLAHLLSVTEEHDFSNLLLKALEPSPFSLLRLPWSQYFLLPARITLIFDQLDDAHGRWRDNFDEALSVSHVPRLAKHNNIPACRLIGLIKNEESANVFERTNGGTLRCVPLGPWSEEDLRKVPTVRPSWESRRTFVRLPSGEVLEAPVYCSDPKRPTAVKVVQFVEQHLGTTVRFKDFVPDTWASSDVASTPLILRMTQVRLPTGDCIAAPFCPNGSQSCAVAVAEILSSHVGRPVRPGELIGDWATSDAVPLRLRGATKVVMPLGDVMPFPYCAGSDQMCAFELAEKLGRYVGHAVRPGELKGDWATSDVVPLRLHPPVKSWPSLFGIPASSASTSV